MAVMPKIKGAVDKDCQKALSGALNALKSKLPNYAEFLDGLTIEVGDNLTKSGGETDVKNKRIVLDAEKNCKSLQEVETYLVKQGLLNSGDWTGVLPEVKDELWSTLNYNLVHEVGHILGGRLLAEQSPTKYGRIKDGEAFPEVFTYWVYGKEIDPKAQKYIDKKWGSND